MREKINWTREEDLLPPKKYLGFKLCRNPKGCLALGIIRSLMKKSLRILVVILVITAIIVPRVAELTKFTAADEPFWLVVGANYYYALTHGEFENTVYEYHPAVTTMWIGTAAMLIYFPEYRGMMDGYFQQEKTSFDVYMVEHGKSPLALLWWARLIQLLLNVSLLIVAFFFCVSCSKSESPLLFFCSHPLRPIYLDNRAC